VPRVRLDLLDQLVLPVLAVPLATVVRTDPPDQLALPDPLVQMDSLVPRERSERADRRVTAEPPAPRDLQGPPDLWDLLVLLESKERVVLRELLVLLVSLVLLDELEPLVPMVTPVPRAPPVPPVKTVLRVCAVTPDPRAEPETLGCADPLEPPERRETPERTVPLVQMVLEVLWVWLGLVVLLVCLVSAEREVSLVSLDLLESPVSRDLLDLVVTVEPLDPSDPLD